MSAKVSELHDPVKEEWPNATEWHRSVFVRKLLRHGQAKGAASSRLATMGIGLMATGIAGLYKATAKRRWKNSIAWALSFCEIATYRTCALSSREIQLNIVSCYVEYYMTDIGPVSTTLSLSNILYRRSTVTYVATSKQGRSSEPSSFCCTPPIWRSWSTIPVSVTPLRRRHTNLWILQTVCITKAPQQHLQLCGRRCCLDELEQIAVERREDTDPLVRNQSTSSSAATGTALTM